MIFLTKIILAIAAFKLTINMVRMLYTKAETLTDCIICMILNLPLIWALINAVKLI